MFNKGDIVLVDYKSPAKLDRWLSGLLAIGPGSIGVVRYATPETGSAYVGNVSVHFPMVGTFGVFAEDLKLLRKAEQI